MSTTNNTLIYKLKTLMLNNELTIEDLAKKMHRSPELVKNWLSGNFEPSLREFRKLCSIFYLTPNDLLCDEIEIPEYIAIDKYLPCDLDKSGETEHQIIDARLEGGALLHRYKNNAGDECSGIYLDKKEIWWHYREEEQRMIHDWNSKYKAAIHD